MPKIVCPCGFPVDKGSKCNCRRKAAGARQKANDERRGSAASRGYDKTWAKESKAFLALPGHDLCACGCGRPADMVDHKIAPKGNMTLFWDRNNWQPFNSICNRRKAIATEGGFGRPVKGG